MFVNSDQHAYANGNLGPRWIIPTLWQDRPFRLCLRSCVISGPSHDLNISHFVTSSSVSCPEQFTFRDKLLCLMPWTVHLSRQSRLSHAWTVHISWLTSLSHALNSSHFATISSVSCLNSSYFVTNSSVSCPEQFTFRDKLVCLMPWTVRILWQIRPSHNRFVKSSSPFMTQTFRTLWQVKSF
jgi:hypothetical protein